MSRFEKFQNIIVYDNNNEPLNEQIYINDCYIYFINGFINNWENETEKEISPAINCTDGHVEYWENGKLNAKDNKPAVISPSDNVIEYWDNGNKKNSEKYYLTNVEESFRKGNDGERAFAKFLNGKNIPFIHLDQPCGNLYSTALSNNNIKRPDYIIFIGRKPLFVDVKATSCQTINKNELERHNAMENEYSINVIFAITKEKKDFNEYFFLSLHDINNYVKIINAKIPNSITWEIYPTPDLLLKNEIPMNEIDNNELNDIFSIEKKEYLKKKFFYSDLLKDYFNEKKYEMKPVSR